MPERARLRCAAESRGRSEPLLGTASRVRRWLVVEQPGPWGREALLDSRLEAEVGHDLRSKGRRLGIRVLIVRRPGWRSEEGRRRVYLAHSGRRSSWIEQLDVDDAHELSHLDLSVLGSETAPGVGEPGPPSVHLVCTNGRHDPCCADFGRPVARALDAAGSPEVWESSHVGGDRFAANVVCLPHGVYYGRVEPEGAAALLDDHRRGLLDIDHYRGRSCFPPLVQAAEVFTRRETGERGLDALSVTAVEARDDDALVVTLEGADGRITTATVARERAGTELITCGDESGSRPWRYRLVSLTTG